MNDVSHEQKRLPQVFLVNDSLKTAYVFFNQKA